MAVQLAGGRPVPVAAGLIPDPDRLAAAIGPRCRGIVTTSPNNPSGVVIPAPVLDAINRLCAERGLVHIHDEAYAEFVHGPEPHRSPGRLSGSAGHTITLSSLSKAYGMAGWRLGYVAVPEALLPALVKVQDTVLICPPLLNQQAGLAALEAGPTWCAPRIERLGERRRQLLKALGQAREAEVPIRLLAEPDGAFYALLEFTTDLPSWTLIERLVLEHGVALLPGECFALPTGPGRVGMRLSYGMLGDVELDRALGRLVTGLKALG
jgi:aspartate/methionine/tyrosine aminotransferase